MTFAVILGHRVRLHAVPLEFSVVFPRFISSRLLWLLLPGLLAFGVGDLHAQSNFESADAQRPWASEADALMREGRFEAAERAYVQLLGQHNDDAGLWLRICYARIELGRVGAALEAAQTARDLEPRSVEAVVMLAQCQALVGDPDAGLRTLENALAVDLENVQLLETMAQIQIGLQRWPAAAGLLRQLIRIDPTVGVYYMDLGRILLTQGAFDESIVEFENARARGGDEALADAMIGKAHLAAGRLDRALQLFARSVAIRPNADAVGGRATVFYLRGEKGNAIKEFRRAIELAPRDADLLFNLGNVLVQTERFGEAEDAFRKSLKIDNSAANTHLNLAVLLIGRFAIDEADQHLRWAARLDPELSGPHLHLGRIAGARFAYDEAIGHYERYRARVQDPREIERIEKSIRQLNALAEKSRTAKAEGQLHLLQVKLASESAALDFIKRVREGEDFYILALEMSELATVAGVDAGFVKPDEIHASFREGVRVLDVGEMTEPIRLETSFFVFKRVE